MHYDALLTVLEEQIITDNYFRSTKIDQRGILILAFALFCLGNSGHSYWRLSAFFLGCTGEHNSHNVIIRFR